MNRIFCSALAALIVGCCALSVSAQEPTKVEGQPTMVPLALLPFQERGRDVKDMGAQATDILFARLVANPDLFLVERQELDKLQKEGALNLSGLVGPDQATRLGQLTGAKIVVTGSVVQAGNELYLVAKVIGTETSRVLGASVKGEMDSALGNLVEKLANEIGQVVVKQSDKLIAPPAKNDDRVAAIKRALGDRKRPAVFIDIDERHVGRTTLDPAAATELASLCKQTDFTVIDSKDDKSLADVILKGEGFSEFAIRHGDLISVKARLEIKAVHRKSGQVLAVGRQTTIAVDLSEQIAGKTALANAAAAIAERLLPEMVKRAEALDAK